jgi:hypothetical protein
MKKVELIDKIKSIVLTIYPDYKLSGFSEYEDEKLLNLPQLRDIIIELLSVYYTNFIERTDWVSPKPMTFRIILKNGYFFYLTYNNPSWSAEIKSKKYNLNNVSEKMSAIKSISNILKLNLDTKKNED